MPVRVISFNNLLKYKEKKMNKALSLFEIPHFTKLTDRFIGFDDLFNEMNTAMNTKMDMGFPPYDIYTEEVEVFNQKGKKADLQKETHTFIEFALAGFDKEDLRVKYDDNVLNVYSEYKQSDESECPKKYIKKGIATRSFSITKTISKDLELVGATYKDGCLIIEFKKKEPTVSQSTFVEIK